MLLRNLLFQRKAFILDRWLNLIFDTYPLDGSIFLKQEKDRFINPVGYTIAQETEVLYQELLSGMNYDKLSTSLDNIIRIRAVQDFSPSQAVSFVFLLKKAIRDELEKEIKEDKLSEELMKFELKIDELALLAFDIYMKCREKIYQIKVGELKAEKGIMLKLLNKKG